MTRRILRFLIVVWDRCCALAVYGRWGEQCFELVPAMAGAATKGFALMLQRRWWGLLGLALQKAVTHMATHSADGGADLYTTMLESPVALADLQDL